VEEQQQTNQPRGDNPKGGAKKKNPLWVLGPAAAFILAKGKTVLALLKFGKFGGAIASMLLFTGLYASLYPWQFAIGLVVMIFIHEMGHVIAAKRKGLPVSAPIFIPFLGALIAMKRNPRDAVTEAYIGYGGPLLGTVGALGAFILGWALDFPVLYSIAYIGFFLNLFNLLPMHPLDGGRISVAVTRWLWLVGLIAAVPIIIYLQSILLGIIWVMSAWSMYDKYVRKRGKMALHGVAAAFNVPATLFTDNGHFIPGELHERELTFTTFSDLTGEHAGRQVVRASWDGIGFQEEMVLQEQSIIRRVYAKAKRDHEGGSVVQLTVVVECMTHVNDQYYEVPKATRWKFGIAYFALAAFLISMMVVVHQVMEQVMMVR